MTNLQWAHCRTGWDLVKHIFHLRSVHHTFSQHQNRAFLSNIFRSRAKEGLQSRHTPHQSSSLQIDRTYQTLYPTMQGFAQNNYHGNTYQATAAMRPRAYTPAPEIFFIDEPTNTRIQLNIKEQGGFRSLMKILNYISQDIAAQVKYAARFINESVPAYLVPLRFSYNDGPYLYRTVTVRTDEQGREFEIRSEWLDVLPTSMLTIFSMARSSTGRIEIQHVLQHFRNLRTRQPPAAPASDTETLTEPFPDFDPNVLPSPNKSESSLGEPGPSIENGPSTPPPPASPRAPSPPPISPVVSGARLVVRVPPVPAPRAPEALAVTPVATGWARGVVDSADVGWYRREEELRGWMRFGVAEVVESVDVWRVYF